MFSSPVRPCRSTVTADDFHVVVFHVFLHNLAADPDADPPPSWHSTYVHRGVTAVLLRPWRKTECNGTHKDGDPRAGYGENTWKEGRNEALGMRVAGRTQRADGGETLE